MPPTSFTRLRKFSVLGSIPCLPMTVQALLYSSNVSDCSLSAPNWVVRAAASVHPNNFPDFPDNSLDCSLSCPDGPGEASTHPNNSPDASSADREATELGTTPVTGGDSPRSPFGFLSLDLDPARPISAEGRFLRSSTVLDSAAAVCRSCEGGLADAVRCSPPPTPSALCGLSATTTGAALLLLFTSSFRTNISLSWLTVV